MCDNKKLLEQLLRKNVKTLEKKYAEIQLDKALPTTSDLYKTYNIPDRFDCPYLFRGYGVQELHGNPFYKTVNSEYGYYYPTVHTISTRYYPRSQKFSARLAKAGLYRNYSLNTQSDNIIHTSKLTHNNLTCSK